METKTAVEVTLLGQDGNVFGIIGSVSKALKKAGHADLAKEFTNEAFAAGSYGEVLSLVHQYVIVS